MRCIAVFAVLLSLACNRESRVETSTTSSAPATGSQATATLPTASSTGEPAATPALEPVADATANEGGSATPVAGPKLAFVDEAAQDPSFVAYRERLLAAVRARDARAVLAMSDPKIRTSFGDVGGAKDLERKLATPEMWRQLEQILTLGGSFRGPASSRSFWAPYVYSTFPENQDSYSSVVVIAERVPLRERPAADAPGVAILSRDILAGDPGEQTQWMQVKTADGRKGWVEQRFVRSPIDYRAGFMKQGNEWKMNVLVAGD